MIKFEEVTKKYGSANAVEDISFEAKEGEFIFLTGHSGAGKTTLIRLLLREITPTSGKVLIEGRDIKDLKSEEIPFYRRKIGVIFQDFKLLPDRTVYENVKLATEIDGRTTPKEEKKIEEALEKVNMSSRANLFPRQLSGGEIQRTVIARVLVQEPKIILADEPTGNLDPETGRQIVDLLGQAGKVGVTVLMATHNADIVNALKHRVVNLKNGKITRDDKSGKYKND
ncbi:MAG: cell division ATP-binding protein FtsE [Candidatus Blackburnbacteria bacterium RIFCSPHIGHO2_01_FULL_44_64]|uniref:Cell division ATP-binding protein FtsE n=1 Tax=Candidatus Blackburnbacteria bacterium RIFCSPHIGHO2_02_FULL_44_20 TaxID=1797516 RepID=A0A1G1V935_9BACT|nr:MAG: cell division ATP-binding protein FtsE [Candidatus Blackburnbacteria bacterium RIFCSPHIGHO2_01_FULL_44_64]OGY11262.1 MAG: cell division ATP-binding protein FtsE [Candidatus Blackburnbacteria bacterium RIFCSPHIGHO2_12_FULL_44_25]OGY11964.1 MAG: cell division ATP-binding protein FtsE [Candidatus Blackburnbacteria bacterium RIFCSPHIGHO2_02_FULL_44_20]OGY14050.1 MAG: cell division ATP-binding protein FtsE [Candidatus Blackburnbacteria bacterium RIFCSPLOWO2_01_FULL_44_43]OGY15376.1 MAG: cell